eukprot:CAMPEP_0183792678 /NCGR_PEP_ID=MMETSP0803_2-20130417/2729_1 /TAXON_ID=195967 /ORGANISM="Crustomastix stigmata, Strain CCMP3273" /LENGTH=66 /DNA_ID=CAMNT_0026037043 /DNA_START=154 /DNA_END=354 /DNA_ORIENTATION=+
MCAPTAHQRDAPETLRAPHAALPKSRASKCTHTRLSAPSAALPWHLPPVSREEGKCAHIMWHDPQT